MRVGGEASGESRDIEIREGQEEREKGLILIPKLQAMDLDLVVPHSPIISVARLYIGYSNAQLILHTHT